jgi:hypothetical protein
VTVTSHASAGLKFDLMSTPLEDARKELETEYNQFRAKGLGRIHEAFDRVVGARSTDDVYGILKNLEDVVHDVRTGGAIGSGAKGHREAREEWVEAGGR